ncbi:hypothetical protein [Ammoniphilus resinae]|uniref:Uncharacterized protein n=1 Tax=Ammoniphilus resinae TaxID=861532 RepID=A0ABS4GXZ1_9BACL|nr:hypothetical protein [Ammoniphilus resinae]MBP1935129.1 hypothetical protein [Ammoniphilus resinae]
MARRRMPRINEETIYEKFTQFIAKSSSLSISMAGLLVILGMITGAFINQMSNDWQLVKAFVIYGVSGFLPLIFGYLIFRPFWKFRRDFHFLEQDGEKLARKLVEINNRAHSICTSVDGVLAFQLFKVERHTSDNHILFTFEEMMRHKTKGFDLSRLKNKKLKIPIEIIEWMKNPQGPPPTIGDDFINKMLYDWMKWRAENDERFEQYIVEWDVSLYPYTRLIGAHYVELFDFTEVVNSDDFTSDMIDDVFENDYNGVNDNHSNRKYYTLRTVIDGEEDGSYRCIALIIANGKLSTSEGVRAALQRILNGGGEHEFS